MKYEKEINQLLRDIIFEDWMTEKEYNDIIDHTFILTGITKEKLDSEIEFGVKNGYSVETQMEAIKIVLLSSNC